MRRIDCGVAGEEVRPSDVSWSELGLSEPWPSVIKSLSPGPMPRTLQIQALRDRAVMMSRRHLVISSPTNSGKTLIGLLTLLAAVKAGRRAVLVEPFRAIAQQQLVELEAVHDQLSEALGRKVQVVITTGDYRLEDDMFTAPPPEHGELIVATPERLEAIHRNPDYDAWFESVGAVCVDEAHLIGDSRRGSTLEYLITSFLSQSTPPRIILLSATLGDTKKLEAWLNPCDVVKVTSRYPALRREVVELEGDEDKKEVTATLVGEALADDDSSALVFVYRTKDAEKLAAELNERGGLNLGTDGAQAYHAQMSLESKEIARSSFLNGRSRCAVATKALGHGVNLPATHVIVRDVTHIGATGAVPVDDLLQMAGRAGRGDRRGHASFVVASGDRWSSDDLASAIREERLPAFVSAYEQLSAHDDWKSPTEDLGLKLAPHIAVLLGRKPDEGYSPGELGAFFDRSLGGRHLSTHVPSALAWLISNTLAHAADEPSIKLTTLGRQATRATLPLPIASGFANLLRDLMVVDPSDKHLDHWQPIDTLLCIDLLNDRSKSLRQFSNAVAKSVDGWVEDSLSKPELFGGWIRGEKGSSKANEVFGSLGVNTTNTNKKSKPAPEEAARKKAYTATMRAILLYEMGKGIPAGTLARNWSIPELPEIQEKWRDEQMWLLSGLTHILDVPCFYYHLREVCEADDTRVKTIERILGKMRRQIFDLIESLKYCSPLGPFLKDLRRARPRGAGQSIGVGTIRRLEEVGITNVKQLMPLTAEDLMQMGIRRDFAQQIRARCDQLSR